MNLQEIRTQAEQIARSAGDMIMSAHWLRGHQEVAKQNIHDIVTEGDKASEAVILAGLRAAFPTHAIVSEEGGVGLVDDSDFTWHIDPIDGTTNFAHHLPYFSISIALADRAGTPLVGVVLNPVYGELYSAARGYGTTLNGKPIRVTKTQNLEQALLASGFPTDKARALATIPVWQAMLMQVRDIRRFGSAALDLCAVAAGRIDGYWETGIHSWDVMAGLLCVQEAGGVVSDHRGGTEQVYSGAQVVASNGGIHAAMLNILSQER